MREDLELWARYLVTTAGWRERSTWFNVRVREIERHTSALMRQAPDVIEDRPPYTLDDARRTLASLRESVQAIEDRLVAVVEMRERIERERNCHPNCPPDP